MNWPQVELQNIALREKGAIVSGPFGSNISAKYFVDEGIPVIRGNNLTKGKAKFIDDGFAYLTETKAAEFRNCMAVTDDIVFTAAGSIGQVGIIPPEARYEKYVISNKQLRVRLDRSKANPNFVFAWLSSHQMVRYLENMNNGGAVPLLNLGIIRRVPVPLPTIETQDKIAEILSAYDDLVENNRRRIALLEEEARLLYREWFVHFRFPGHEFVKIIAGLPEGWEMSNASVVMEVFSGGTPKTGNPAFWDGEIGFFTPKDVTDTPFVLETEKTISEEGLRACNSKLYPCDTVFITARGTVGKLNMALVPMAMNQSCYALRSKIYLGQKHLFLALKSAIEQVRARATGAVFDAIIVATFANVPFTLPPKRLTDIFARHSEPIFDQIANLVQQNSKLVQARDLLLPRLMNGEITV